MPSKTVAVCLDVGVKTRLEKLAKSTARSCSCLAAEAIEEYLKVNEWQVTGIRNAMASLDRAEGISHQEVKDWVASLGRSRRKR